MRREACTWVCGCHSTPAGRTQHRVQRREDTLQHRTHQIDHFGLFFWILPFSALHRCLIAAGCSQDLLSFWGSFTCLHLAPDASVICCRWVPGAARNMPAGFQQLGGEVISFFFFFFFFVLESIAQLKYVVGLVFFYSLK